MRHPFERAFSRLSPLGRRAFLAGVPKGGRLLDVGCANGSLDAIAKRRPDLDIWGIDVTKDLYFGVYKFVESSSNNFAQTLADIPGQFDAVISKHNIEHCEDSRAVLTSMAQKTAPSGRMFIATPTLKSISFPSRAGTLNFYDDETHRSPVSTIDIVDTLEANDCLISAISDPYRPPAQHLCGQVLEPISRFQSKVLPGTWAYWGFEAVIWAKKK